MSSPRTRRRDDRRTRTAALSGVRSRHPKFFDAIRADAKLAAAYRGEQHRFESRFEEAVQCVRLLAETDAFLALALYRMKARWQALGVPVLPRLAHRAAMLLADVCIGDPVVVAPGIQLLHGQVVIDGFTTIGSGAHIAPFVTIGLKGGSFTGPTVGENVSIGTGAKIIGPVTIGDGVLVGANAVVVSDIPAGATAVGIPAHVKRDH